MPNRTDMYEKIGRALQLPQGQLAQLAEQQRREQLRKRLGDQPTPLLHNVRELILRKCHPRKTRQIRAIFEKQHFGELERFVIQKDVRVPGKRTGQDFRRRARAEGISPRSLTERGCDRGGTHLSAHADV
ncbi:MAG TPA: hypothetical protein VFU48_05495 [Nitrospira sp.]|nr:hypothetical protein [Nitrospira sp.]